MQRQVRASGSSRHQINPLVIVLISFQIQKVNQRGRRLRPRRRRLIIERRRVMIVS
jgi:hypothetical protein